MYLLHRGRQNVIYCTKWHFECENQFKININASPTPETRQRYYILCVLNINCECNIRMVRIELRTHKQTHRNRFCMIFYQLLRWIERAHLESYKQVASFDARQFNVNIPVNQFTKLILLVFNFTHAAENKTGKRPTNDGCGQIFITINYVVQCVCASGYDHFSLSIKANPYPLFSTHIGCSVHQSTTHPSPLH